VLSLLCLDHHYLYQCSNLCKCIRSLLSFDHDFTQTNIDNLTPYSFPRSTQQITNQLASRRLSQLDSNAVLRRGGSPFSAGDPVRRISPTAALLLCACEQQSARRRSSQLGSYIFMLPLNSITSAQTQKCGSVTSISRRVVRSVDFAITCLSRGVVMVSDEAEYRR
jgi:hypothetical protein